MNKGMNIEHIIKKCVHNMEAKAIERKHDMKSAHECEKNETIMGKHVRMNIRIKWKTCREKKLATERWTQTKLNRTPSDVFQIQKPLNGKSLC